MRTPTRFIWRPDAGEFHELAAFGSGHRKPPRGLVAAFEHVIDGHPQVLERGPKPRDKGGEPGRAMHLAGRIMQQVAGVEDDSMPAKSPFSS